LKNALEVRDDIAYCTTCIVMMPDSVLAATKCSLLMRERVGHWALCHGIFFYTPPSWHPRDRAFYLEPLETPLHIADHVVRRRVRCMHASEDGARCMNIASSYNVHSHLPVCEEHTSISKLSPEMGDLLIEDKPNPPSKGASSS